LPFKHPGRTIHHRPSRRVCPTAMLPKTLSAWLTEDSLQRIVTAFQRFAEALYDRKPGRPKLRRNAFQNPVEGSRHWKSAFG
jgi:hypothetical protein